MEKRPAIDLGTGGHLCGQPFSQMSDILRLEWSECVDNERCPVYRKRGFVGTWKDTKQTGVFYVARLTNQKVVVVGTTVVDRYRQRFHATVADVVRRFAPRDAASRAGRRGRQPR